MAQHYQVKALGKGLALIEALNHLGEAGTAELAETVSLPRPTTHRLLETLQSLGYVTREGHRSGFRLTVKVHGLSDQLREDDALAEIATPFLEKLGDEVVWPLDIAVYEDGAMVIKSTTHRRSPLSLERVASGKRIPVDISACGRAFLAFSSPATREQVLQLHLQTLPRDDSRVRHPELLLRELEATRQRGCGLRVRGPHPKTSSISVPVMAGDQVVACIIMNWIASALTAEVVLQRYLASLQRCAKRIGAAYKKTLHAEPAESDEPAEPAPSRRGQARSKTRNKASPARPKKSR